jgi:DNA/RNA endonuclease G (NUC1)
MSEKFVYNNYEDKIIVPNNEIVKDYHSKLVIKDAQEFQFGEQINIEDLEFLVDRGIHYVIKFGSNSYPDLKIYFDLFKKQPLLTLERITDYERSYGKRLYFRRAWQEFGLHKFEKAQAFLRDYRYSGFDRGHLAAAGNHPLEFQAVTYNLVNVCPQAPCFNRLIWRYLEDDIRSIAKQHNEVYCLTAPFYSEYIEPKFIGPNKLEVPTHFLKIIKYKTDMGEKKEKNT